MSTETPPEKKSEKNPRAALAFVAGIIAGSLVTILFFREKPHLADKVFGLQA